VISDSPAESAGLRKGDVLVEIDGKSVEDMGFYHAGLALTGTNGSQVTVTVQRVVSTHVLEMEYTATRTEVKVNSLFYEVLNQQIGYVMFHSFEDTTLEEFREAMAFFKEKSVSSLILDVRNNTSEAYEIACHLADEILPEGNFVKITEKDGKESFILCEGEGISLPVAVLINSATTAAPELFAAVLRDGADAVLVGETSKGKCTDQKIVALDDGSALLLTYRSFSPVLSSYANQGVLPNVATSLAGKNVYLIRHKEDNQLQEAIKQLQK